MSNPTCPICKTEMRQTRRGATLVKRGPCYVCPVDESEIYKDSAGHLHRFGWGQHTGSVRTWEEGEIPPHPMGCICDTPDACVACTPEPDPDALDFVHLVGLGMTPAEAAEVKDFEYFDFEEWQASHVYAL